MKTVRNGACFGTTKRYNFVCFTCKTNRKDYGEANCPQCREPMACIGERIPVPPKQNNKAWKKLQKQIEDWEKGCAAARNCLTP